MKKLVLFSVFTALFSVLAPFPLFAQSDMSYDASSGAKKTIEYDLPYPGLLPDNPFYPLKMFRDRVVGFLIADPIKKAEFSLLQSDKRFQGGYYLFNKDHEKANLALATIAKGQNYFDESLQSVAAARKQGYSVAEVTAHLSLSSQKQLEILKTLSSVMPLGEKAYYQQILRRAEELVKKAEIEAKKK